jgi:multiple sugar transport system permease protein
VIEMTSIPIAEPTDTSTAVRPALVVTPTAPGRGKRRWRPGRVLAWVALGAVLGATLFPFWWVVRTGLSNTRS